MGFRGGVVLLGLLLCSTPACAEGKGDEYRYLQRVQLLSQVNQALWRSIEASGASGLWDPALATYAREVTGLGLDRLRGDAPPRELSEFHRELVDLFS